MTPEELESWLQRYGAAWEARDGDLAAALFTPGGVYCWGPFDPPLEGREAIRDRWRQATETQRDVSFRHEVLGTDGSRAFVRWWSTFSVPAAGSRTELDGVFVLDFAEDGLCARLQEWWLARAAQ
jgi:hypothetical protein